MKNRENIFFIAEDIILLIPSGKRGANSPQVFYTSWDVHFCDETGGEGKQTLIFPWYASHRRTLWCNELNSGAVSFGYAGKLAPADNRTPLR